MTHEWLEREDLSVFVVSGVPKGFNRRLQEFVAGECGENAKSLRVPDDLGPWITARVRGRYRPSSLQSPASKALWRAFRALAAARYHLKHDPERRDALRRLREEVESHWHDVSPMHRKAAD